jgi:hypothetical protein
MAEVHEEHLAEVYGGHRTRGSGNQWREQTDGRQSHRELELAFAWDGKSTRGDSIGVSKAMLHKVREQAHGERPLLPLRYYEDDRLRIFEDYAVIREDDLLALMEMAVLL